MFTSYLESSPKNAHWYSPLLCWLSRVFIILFSSSHKVIQRAKSANNSLVRAVFDDNLAYTFAEHNFIRLKLPKNYFLLVMRKRKCFKTLSFIIININSDIGHGTSSIDSIYCLFQLCCIPYVVCFNNNNK